MVSKTSQNSSLNPLLTSRKPHDRLTVLQLTESLIKGAIPVLSHKSAAVCLVLNCLCPGLGAVTRATCRVPP